jgi:hypothetical protein
MNLWLVYKERKKRKTVLWKGGKMPKERSWSSLACSQQMNYWGCGKATWNPSPESLSGSGPPLKLPTTWDCLGFLSDFRKIELVIYADRVDEDIPCILRKIEGGIHGNI